MKKFSATLLILASIFLFISCQKQLEFDNDGNSVGTLKANAGGDCLPSYVNGIYKADTVLTVQNYIDVQIDITTPGAYNIYSDSINGYSFKKAGTIGATGLQTIRLYGSGKPLASGINIFTINYGTSSCKINVNVAGTVTMNAVFSLSGAPDTCANFIATGNFIAGQAVTPGEFLTLTVNVTTVGTYNLSSSNNDGLSFSGAGFFTNTGLQNVTLNAVGTPASGGDKYFNILYAVGCPFKVLVYQALAEYNIGGAGGTCTGAVVAGVYKSNTALTSANTVTINVNVTKLGYYGILSNTVNGVTFESNGIFTNTGPTTVVLKGRGTPIAAGDSTFNAACNFVISFAQGPGIPPPEQKEYLPMTTGTNYDLEFVGDIDEDSVHVRVLPDNITLSGKSYRIFKTSDGSGELDSLYYRKDNGKYYQYHNDGYGADNKFNIDGLIFDSSLAVNGTWTTNLGNNTVGGNAITAKYQGKILEKNATATIAGVTYYQIIKVQITYQVSILSLPYQDVLINTTWYAKGKGIIYQKLSDAPPTTATEIITKNIYVAP